MPPLLTLERLVVGYRRRPMLPPLDAILGEGEMWCLLGTNGSGKSTLLRTALGLLPAVDGRAVRGQQRLSYVPQQRDVDLTLPMRVIDFVRGGVVVDWSFLNPIGMFRASDVVERALADTVLGELRRERIADLSEGQRQRAFVARALVSNPGLLVLDEPTSAMDPENELAVFELLDRLRKERGVSVLMASHAMSLAARHCEYAIFVDREHGVADCGELAKVAASAAFRRAYGELSHDW